MYSGKSSFRYIDRLIKERSGLLMICTPYIDMHYIRILIRESRKKRIMLVSSRASENKLKGLRLKGLRKDAVGFSLFYIAALFLLYPKWVGFPFLFAFPLAVSTAVAVYSLRTNIDVKIVKESFVHEKIYINDTKAITGSANLTFAGTHLNVEHIDIIDGASGSEQRNKVLALRSHFMELWKGH